MSSNEKAASKGKRHIPNRLVIAEAASSKASCKVCGKGITAGSLRIERKVTSGFHDGFDIQFHHLECGWDLAADLYDFGGWGVLPWSELKFIATFFSERVDEGHPVVRYVKEAHNLIWRLKEFLRGVDVDNRVVASVCEELFDINWAQMTKVNREGLMPLALADQIVLGRLPCCPLCGNRSLVGPYPEIRCLRGEVDGSECEFRYVAVDILRPDKPRLPMLPVGVTREALDRCVPIPVPSKIVSNWKVPLDSPAVSKFGSPETWEVEAAGEDSDPDMDAAVDAPGILGVQLALTNSALLCNMDQRVSALGGEIVEASKVSRRTSYLLVPRDAPFRSVDSRSINLAEELSVAILYEDFLLAMLDDRSNGPAVPCPNTSVQWKLETQRKEPFKDAPLELFGFPSGRRLRSRRMATWYWTGRGRVPHVRMNELRELKLSREAVKREDVRLRCRRRLSEAPRYNSDARTVECDIASELLAKGFNSEIYVCSTTNHAYHAMMSKVDTESGFNKFYMQQIVVTSVLDASPMGKRRCSTPDEPLCSVGVEYRVVRKWGRVGAPEGSLKNGIKVDDYGSNIKSAIHNFHQRCLQLTSVDFLDRYAVNKTGGYDYVLLNGEDQVQKEHVPSNDFDDRLPPPDETVLSLIAQLFDHSHYQDCCEEFELDLASLKSGSTYAPAQITKAMYIMRDVEALVTSSDRDATFALKLSGLRNRFYQALPHVWRGQPVGLDTPVAVRLMAYKLNDLYISAHKPDLGSITSPLALYRSLGVHISPVELENSRAASALCELVSRTGPTHSFTIVPSRVFEIMRPSETADLSLYRNAKERQLLFHGSRSANWAGILATGLRKAPPEAPKTGYMFGKGVYLADLASKAAIYATGRTGSRQASNGDGRGWLLVVEACLEEALVLTEADFEADKSLADRHSHVLGQGQWSSVAKVMDSFTSADPEVTAPITAAASKLQHRGTQGELLYNEFVFYDTKRLAMRYLIEVTTFDAVGASIVDDAALLELLE